MSNRKGFVFLPSFIWFVIALIGIGTVGAVVINRTVTSSNMTENNQTVDVSPSPELNPTAIPTSHQVEPVYVDSDPIIVCTSSFPNCTGQSIKVRQSVCPNITCCGFKNNRWVIYPSNEACDQDQAAETNQQTNIYPPCTVFYKYSGYSKTYNYMSPSDCLYWQERASISMQPLSIPDITVAPLPTVAPYQYSQEYLDSLKNANNTFNQQWQPTQFVAPTPKCYATWDEYFNAHPNYAPQNIKGTSTTPPCD